MSREVVMGWVQLDMWEERDRSLRGRSVVFVARNVRTDREGWRGCAVDVWHAAERCVAAMTRGARRGEASEDPERGFVVVRTWRETDTGEGSERSFYLQAEELPALPSWPEASGRDAWEDHEPSVGACTKCGERERLSDSDQCSLCEVGNG